MTKLYPAKLASMKKRYPEVPEQCFDCPCWNNIYPTACDRFYNEQQAWKAKGGCPVARQKEGKQCNT